ncbi:MAG: putative oxidoreductase C-terminal domain-containing protein [Bacteroidales bacterium]
MKKFPITLSLVALLLLVSCGTGQESSNLSNSTSNSETMFTPVEGDISLINLAPGHFHAALVQKSMYEGVDPVVHVYAPEGPELQEYLSRINDYNTRADNPTSWKEQVYTGNDYLEKMLEDKAGNVMVVSGNNAKKTEYILKAAQAGINVLADKPMVITPEQFPMLENAFKAADQQGVLIYDIMTERYEITTILQKALSQIPEVFGQLQTGTLEEPAITKESVHHFLKNVSGKPLIRPPWFFDVEQQGEGMADVGTHLVDLVQWEAFPGVVLNKSDVEILTARHWTTDLTKEEFQKVTGLDAYPEYLKKYLDEDLLKVTSNGEINYKLKGVHARVSVTWNYEAPEGTGDTHYSIMRGTGCNLTIRQGDEEGYVPTLYIDANGGTDPATLEMRLKEAVEGSLSAQYPGIAVRKIAEGRWMLEIPDRYRVGHEAHFGQVTETYLEYLHSGILPDWEIPNMIVKYYTTTEGIKKAMEPPVE